MMGGTIFVSAGQSTFSNILLQTTAEDASNLDSATVISTGASKLREVFTTAEELNAVLGAYMAGLRASFILAVAVTGCAFLACGIPPIKSIKRTDPEDRTAAVA